MCIIVVSFKLFHKFSLAGPEVVDIALPQLHRHSLVHCSQRFDWDCGVACVMMMLSRRQRQQFLLNFKQICDEEGFGQRWNSHKTREVSSLGCLISLYILLIVNSPFCSTWTIDLCYLLWRFKIRHAYTTITVGVNPDFRSHDYYGPILWRDHVRVSTKFDSAACKGLTIQKKTVDNQAILEHLAKYGPVIVLTNGYLLHCDLCHFAHPKCLDKLR